MFPQEVADKLAGRTFENFDAFRNEFWKTVAGTPSLAGEFGLIDRLRMSAGYAPLVAESQVVGGQASYILHHVKPIAKGGAVYDPANLRVVTPRFHLEALDPSVHFGGE